jgi:mannose-6-phosphate isomerase class I
MLRRPVPLRPDNFTPLTRTPWASDELARTIKRAFVPGTPPTPVGESWDFSCDPDFPSRLARPAPGLATTLPELVAHFADAVLSPALAARAGGVCEVLVKLLSPSEPLSLQVHPADDDSGLAAQECGKPESWFVLSARPGAGIYLGFKQAVTKAELRRRLAEAGEGAAELLQFVPVQPGDYFEIAPGVAHAVGAGLVLLEPQRISFGKSGKTFRLWDWGRRYDAAGHKDLASGAPRPLHLEQGLRLIDPERQVGSAFVDSLRRTPQSREEAAGLRVRRFPGNGYYQTLILDGTGGARATLQVDDGYGALVVISGSLQARSRDQHYTEPEVESAGSEPLGAGQPALLPHAAMPVDLRFMTAGQAALIIPAGATCTLTP